MTMHGECTSPVTTALGLNFHAGPSRRSPRRQSAPEITTRLPSICPSTLARSPRITVCLGDDVTFHVAVDAERAGDRQRTFERYGPWSMNPVHSSLALLFGRAGPLPSHNKIPPLETVLL